MTGAAASFGLVIGTLWVLVIRGGGAVSDLTFRLTPGGARAVDDGARRVWDSSWKHPHQEWQVELGVVRERDEGLATHTTVILSRVLDCDWLVSHTKQREAGEPELQAPQAAALVSANVPELVARDEVAA